MSSVFGHGQLRLYLLALLAEGPHHGYDVIRDLEARFQGLYSPSAGTVYPRLAKLESEGLVERTAEGRKATYRISGSGLEEVRDRAGDLARLEAELDVSLRQLATGVRHPPEPGAPPWVTELTSALHEVAEEVRRSALDGHTEEQVRQVRAIIAQAHQQLHQVLQPDSHR